MSIDHVDGRPGTAPVANETPGTHGSGVKFSVVVAVYNTGSYLEACVNSLLGQSLPESELEIILVDDGSDDGVTAPRLDELAAAHANVQAIHIPNSGWPGKPRNVGTDAATGEYVYFLDHDDWLAPEALERLYAIATRNAADVVIGKIAGHGRRVPATLFSRNYEKCDVETAPLMQSMTPHKGFRRAFLQENGIRFPEGRRRLEDHVFVIEAYLLARTVSVLSDYTCYHHIARDDAGNAGFQKIEPVGYYGNLREAVGVAERLTDPGPRRDLVLRRWYSVEMLRRVTGKVFHRMSDEDRRAMYDEVRRLALEHFTSPGIWEPLPAAERVASHLLREGRYDDLVALSDFTTDLSIDHEVVSWQWRGDRLELVVEAAVVTSQGVPAVSVVDGDRRYAAWLPDVPDDARAVRAEPEWDLDVRLRDGETRHLLPLRTELVDPATGRVRLAAELEVSAAAAPEQVALTRGLWDLYLRVQDRDAGVVRGRRIGAEHGRVTAGEPPAVAFLGIEATPVVPYATVKGNLSVEVSPKAGKVGAAMAPGGIPVSADGGVDVELPLHVTAPALPGSWSVGTKASPASPASPDAGGQPRPETPVRARATATKVADTADRVRVQAQLPTRPDGPVALSWHSKPPAWMADEAKTPSSAATAPAAAAPGSASQARQARPTLGELRAVTQPASTMDRRNAEHWLARLFLRKVSLRVTALLIRTPVSANALTGLMIVVGLLAAVTVGLVPGWFGIVLTFLLIQAYFLLDLCDGEVARWRRTTSITGVYLDRVGHYLVEAAILSGIGLRAGDHELGGWSTLGVATGLCAVLVKAETDLVDVARVRAGASAAAEAAVELRSSALGGLRRAAQVLKVHQLTGALEVSFLLLVAMVVDLAAGGLTGTRILAVVLAAIAGVMVVVHLASILLSRRLE